MIIMERLLWKKRACVNRGLAESRAFLTDSNEEFGSGE
jgi:hypothetical protein